jgi:hypothetical protein
MTHAWFFGRLVPMFLGELSDALRARFFDDVTAEEQAEISGLVVLFQTASQVSMRIAMRGGTPAAGLGCPEARVRCICGHSRAVHETSSPHACHGPKAFDTSPSRCECASFTPSEPLYAPPETERPPPPPKEDPDR